MKWIYVIILEKCSHVEYFYTQINNNQMQRGLFTACWGVVYTFIVFKLQHFEGRHDADVVKMSLTPLI